MANTLRVAVCQLECHPALVIADKDLLREPFVPGKNQPSLSDFARYALDVQPLQSTCSQRYLDWHQRRVEAVVAALAGLTPVPDLIVFPECSLPINCLYELRAFAMQHGSTVFAGTHSPKFTNEYTDHFSSLGLPKKLLKNLATSGHSAILPIFNGNNSLAHVKSVPSVFEQTDLARSAGISSAQPIALNVRGSAVSVLPLVCAEALHLNSTSGNYSLAVIVAYNDGIAPFMHTIQQHIRNRIPVIFCNDGRYGESSVQILSDSRMSAIWWWASPLNGILPRGDGILVVDLEMDHQSVQSGVSNPIPSAHLVRLLPVVSGQGRFTKFAGELLQIAERGDNSIQASLLDACLAREQSTALQQVLANQLKRLCSAGTASLQWWETIGQSCLLPSTEDLTDLEAVLAGICRDTASQLLDSPMLNDDGLIGQLTRFRRCCNDRCSIQAPSAARPEPTTTQPAGGILDREIETRDVRTFLDSQKETLLCVTGLEDVGKGTVVEAALTQAGRRNIYRVTLESDATLPYLVASLRRHVQLPFAQDTSTALDLAQEEFLQRLPLGATILVNNVDNLRDHGQWRDAMVPQQLIRLAEQLRSRSAKLILLSTYRIDLDGITPGAMRRIQIRGLPEEHAVLLLDQHLRRVGADPTHYDLGVRKDMASTLGHHPGGIILAAEYVEQNGFLAVLEDLKRRGRTHTEIVRRILTRFQFTEDEAAVIGALNEARIAIPATVLVKAGISSAISATNSLIHASIVERHKGDCVKLTDLVRGFADIRSVHPQTALLFHKTAADYCRECAGDLKTAEQLSMAVESKFHAELAGDPNLAAPTEGLSDGVLGAIQRLLDEHDYERAKPLIERLLQTEQSAEIYQLGALTYARLGLCEEALTLLRECLSRDRNRLWIATEVGKLSLHVHRSDIAGSCLELAKRVGHDSSYLATLEGKILLREKGDAGAVAAFERAVQMAESESTPWDAWPHFYLGRTYLRLGRIEDAIEVLFRGEGIASTRFGARKTVLPAIRTQLAIGYVYNNDLEGARQVFDVIMATDRGKPEVVWAFALYRAAAGDAGEAPTLATEMLRELDPKKTKTRYDRCQVHLFRAMIFLGIGNAERASEEFKHANEQDPRNVYVLLRWAKTLVELARKSEMEDERQAARLCAEHAKSLADRVLEFDRGNAEALELLELLSDEFSVQ